MYRKYFFKNNGVLSRKFVASGLVAVFSSGIFGGYAGAMDSDVGKGTLIEKDILINNINQDNYKLTTLTVKSFTKEDKQKILEFLYNKENKETFKEKIDDSRSVMLNYCDRFTELGRKKLTERYFKKFLSSNDLRLYLCTYILLVKCSEISKKYNYSMDEAIEQVIKSEQLKTSLKTYFSEFILYFENGGLEHFLNEVERECESERKIVYYESLYDSFRDRTTD